MDTFWKHKTVLVTGATGLVGHWLVKNLIDNKARVVIFVRDADPQSELIRSGILLKTTVVNGSLENFNEILRGLNEHEVDTVFHLGAQTIVGTALRHPLQTFESNIRGSYNLLEACRQLPTLVKRVIIASSDKAYGSSPCLPYSEDTPLNGSHPYDVSKSCTDLIALTYAKTYSLPIGIARCGNIYGGGDLNWSRLIPGTIRSLYNKDRPVIRSDGLFTRDYIYVKDVVNAYLTLGASLDKEQIQGQAFNFGMNKPYSVIDIVKTITKSMDCQALEPQVLNQASAEIQNQTLCSKKAEKLLGWKPFYSLEEGLHETIAWYQKYLAEQSQELLYEKSSL